MCQWHYPLTTSLCGSHGLSARRARRTKSSWPEGPPTRSWGPEGPLPSSVTYSPVCQHIICPFVFFFLSVTLKMSIFHSRDSVCALSVWQVRAWIILEIQSLSYSTPFSNWHSQILDSDLWSCNSPSYLPPCAMSKVFTWSNSTGDHKANWAPAQTTNLSQSQHKLWFIPFES